MIDIFNNLLFLLFVVAPIGTIVHESGHAIGAKLVKADTINLSIGLGKEIGTFSFKNLRMTVHLFFFLGGFVQSNRKPAYRSLEIICITAFGSVNNGIFAILFYLLNGIYYNQYIQILFLFNLWLAIVNMIPFKLKGKQSDGYMILKTLFKET